MGRPIAITAVPPSPSEDQRHRFVMYSVTMTLRVVCILACLFVPGWWRLLCLVGAVVLPYFAVILANVARTAPTESPESPGHLQLPPQAE